MERISDIGIALAVSSNRSILRRNTNYRERISELGTTLTVTSVLQLLVTANVVPSSPILVTLMVEAIRSSETSALTRATRRNIPEDQQQRTQLLQPLLLFLLSSVRVLLTGRRCDLDPPTRCPFLALFVMVFVASWRILSGLGVRLYITPYHHGSKVKVSL
jgi:hypothetical protein